MVNVVKKKIFDGRELQKLRLDTRPLISQEEMAKLMGLSRKTISRIENNMPEAIEALSMDNVQKWIAACEETVLPKTVDALKSEIARYFKLELK